MPDSRSVGPQAGEQAVAHVGRGVGLDQPGHPAGHAQAAHLTGVGLRQQVVGTAQDDGRRRATPGGFVGGEARDVADLPQGPLGVEGGGVVAHLADLVGPAVPPGQLRRVGVDDVGVAGHGPAHELAHATELRRGPVQVLGRRVALHAGLQVGVEVVPVLPDGGVEAPVVEHGLHGTPSPSARFERLAVGYVRPAADPGGEGGWRTRGSGLRRTGPVRTGVAHRGARGLWRRRGRDTDAQLVHVPRALGRLRRRRRGLHRGRRGSLPHRGAGPPDDGRRPARAARAAPGRRGQRRRPDVHGRDLDGRVRRGRVAAALRRAGGRRDHRGRARGPAGHRHLQGPAVGRPDHEQHPAALVPQGPRGRPARDLGPAHRGGRGAAGG